MLGRKWAEVKRRSDAMSRRYRSSPISRKHETASSVCGESLERLAFRFETEVMAAVAFDQQTQNAPLVLVEFIVD